MEKRRAPASQGQVVAPAAERYLPEQAVLEAAAVLWGRTFDPEHDSAEEWSKAQVQARRMLMMATPIIRSAALADARGYFLRKGMTGAADHLLGLRAAEGVNRALVRDFAG